MMVCLGALRRASGKRKKGQTCWLRKRRAGGGDQVRITVMLRGREQTHPERAEPILRKFAKDLESYAKAEFPLVFEERQVSLTFTPKIIA